MNLKIKVPGVVPAVCPRVWLKRVGDYFELDGPSPYMLLVAAGEARALHRA